MAIEIVDFPMKNGDFPWQNVSSPEGSSFSWGIPKHRSVFFSASSDQAWVISHVPIFHITQPLGINGLLDVY